MKKQMYKKMLIFLLLSGCLAVVLMFPRIITLLYDDHIQSKISYPNSEKEAALNVDIQNGYSSEEIILSINDALMANGVYENDELLAFLMEPSYAEISEEAAFDAELEKEAAAGPELQYELLFEQTPDVFIKKNPGVILKIRENMQDHVDSGLYAAIPDLIDENQLNMVAYYYLNYKSEDGRTVLSTLLWHLYFENEDGFLKIAVNPYDGSGLWLSYDNWSENAAESMYSLVDQRNEDILDLQMKILQENKNLARNYGAVSADNRILQSDMILEMNKSFPETDNNAGDRNYYYLFGGTLNYDQDGTVKSVPFLNLIMTDAYYSSQYAIVYGPAWCLDLVR